MTKIYDNISHEIITVTSFKKAMKIAKNRCRNYKVKTCIIHGGKDITIAEVVL